MKRYAASQTSLISIIVSRPVWKSKFYGAFVLNHRVVLHAIDATPARWRGDAGSSPLDRARTAASSPRNDLVKNCRVHPTHWLISTQVSDVYVSRVALRQGPFRNEGAALLKFLRNGSLTAASASADVPGAPDPYVASLVEQEMCERAAAFVGTADSTWTSLVAHQRFARGENCSTSFEQLLSRHWRERCNPNMPQGLVARELLARGVESFRLRCV